MKRAGQHGGGRLALGELWAALDELEEDQRIHCGDRGGAGGRRLVIQHEIEGHDYTESRFDSNNDLDDTRENDGEHYFSPLSTRNPRRDITVYTHVHWEDHGMSDDGAEPRGCENLSGKFLVGPREGHRGVILRDVGKLHRLCDGGEAATCLRSRPRVQRDSHVACASASIRSTSCH